MNSSRDRILAIVMVLQLWAILVFTALGVAQGNKVMAVLLAAHLVVLAFVIWVPRGTVEVIRAWAILLMLPGILFWIVTLLPFVISQADGSRAADGFLSPDDLTYGEGLPSRFVCMELFLTIVESAPRIGRAFHDACKTPVATESPYATPTIKLILNHESEYRLCQQPTYLGRIK